MKNILLLTSLFLFCFSASSQNKDYYFKTIPAIDDSTPDWAKKMYAADPNTREVDFEFYQFYKDNPFVKNIHTQNYKHWRQHIEEYIDKEGIIRPSTSNSLVPTSSSTPSNVLTPWINIGPFETYNDINQGLFPVSWQVNIYCLDQSVTNPDVLFAGTESGGIFKTTDKGLTWSITAEDMPLRTVWDIKIAPTNADIVYAISNEVIYKTIDGGSTWQSLYDINSGAYQLEIHPTNPDIVFLAGENGLYQTTDGGDTWNIIQNGQSWDVKVHPTNYDIVYLLKTNNAINRCEFFKSTDGGNSFVLKDNGWYYPTNVGEANDGGARIGLTPAAPDQIYVALIGESKANDNGWIGVYKSTDAAESWLNPNLPDGGPYNANTHQNLATINVDGTGFHQGFYNFGIAVSHNDPDLLWIGCLSLSQSSNGGTSWERIGGYSTGPNDIGWIHPDVQDLHVLGDDVWVCTDGGINYSADDLLTHESRKYGIYGSNYWGFGQGWNEDVLVGGRYHNGNSGYYQTYGLGNSLRLGGAEAGTGYVNPLKERRAYFSDINTKVLPLSIDGPVGNLNKLSIYPNETYSVSYSSEVVFHPYYADHIYLGKDNNIWKSVNEGGSFDLLYQFPVEGRVLEIEIARANPDMMYCVFQPGTSYWGDCELYRSLDGGTTWTETTPLPTNETWRLEISVNQESEFDIWAISVNGNDNEVVFSSDDGGDTWTNRSTPTISGHVLYDIHFQSGTDYVVYIATYTGFFYWDNNAGDWVDYSAGFPELLFPLQMEPFYRDNKLRVATRGRGIYETSLATESNPFAQPMTATDKIYCTRDTVQLDCYSILNHEGASWEWNISPLPPYVSAFNVRNPRVVFSEEGSYSVALTVTTADGMSSTNSIDDFITVFNNCQPDTIPGLALECTASGDYASTPEIGVTTNEFTMTAWVKPEGIQNEYTGIVMNNGDAAGINFKANNELGYHWPGGQWWWNSGLFAPDGEWTYVALVAEPNSVTVYANGIASVHNININPVDMTSLFMGSYKGWGGRNYTGQIDEVCLWNRALSQEEIRELRHLTKDDVILNDPDLVAYYQFNETEGGILDRSGTLHANLVGNAFRNASSGPFGGGSSARINVNSGGEYTFGDTGLSATFPGSGVFPNGELVATRINLLPNEIPNDNPNIGNYWIVNNYGTTAFSPLENFRLSPPYDEISDAIINDPTRARLFVREENGYLADWSEYCAAAEADSEFIGFDTGCGISVFSQFFITSDDPDITILNDGTVSTNEVTSTSVKLYPNPIITAGQLQIQQSSNERLRLKLYSSNGKLVQDIVVAAIKFDSERWP